MAADAAVEMIEPIAICDVFVSGLGNVERIADCLRFSYFVEQGSDKVLVAKLVIPMSVVSRLRDWPARYARAIHFADTAEITLQ